MRKTTYLAVALAAAVLTTPTLAKSPFPVPKVTQSPSIAFGQQHRIFKSYPVVCEKRQTVVPNNTQYRLAIKNVGSETIPTGTRLSFKTDNPKVQVTNFGSASISIPPGEVFGDNAVNNWPFPNSLTFTTCTATAVNP